MRTWQRLLLVTDHSTWGDYAAKFAREHGFEVTHFAWTHGDFKPVCGIDEWSGEWIVAFKADYILSGDELARANRDAINFHLGPPDIRGVGTCEWAIKQGRHEHGATCHHMTERVDDGPIIDVRYFPVSPLVDAADLREKTACHLYLLYIDILIMVIKGESLPSSDKEWSGPLHKWSDLG